MSDQCYHILARLLRGKLSARIAIPQAVDEGDIGSLQAGLGDQAEIVGDVGGQVRVTRQAENRLEGGLPHRRRRGIVLRELVTALAPGSIECDGVPGIERRIPIALWPKDFFKKYTVVDPA